MIKTTRLIRPIIANGALVYNESSRASSILRLKKVVIEEFQLQSKNNCFYQLEFWRDYATTLERIKEAQENEEGIPLLLWIRKEVRHE